MKIEKFKTVKQISIEKGISIHTIRQWIRTHKIKARQTVNGYVIEEQELERFLKERGKI